MIRAKGTNQYRTKYRYDEIKACIFLLFILLSIAFVGLEKYRANNITRSVVVAAFTATDAYAEEPKVIPTPTYTPTATPTPTVSEHNQKDIEDYVRVIFGKNSRVAIAVSHNECNPLNPQYPKCVLHTSAEYSVGIFQINLYNERHWIHAQKVPGSTMEEKIEWLKDPYHNTLIAFKIFTDSGFYPWSAYTSGNYKNSL